MVSFNFKSFLGLFLLIPLFWIIDRIQPQNAYHIYSQERLLSYIPPIAETSDSQTLFNISMKKLNVFEDDPLDKVALLEQFDPIIDSVIVIPKGFHAFGYQAMA